jgi:predicted transcriptional regulator
MTTRAIGRRYDRALAEVGVRQVAYAILGRLDAEGPLSINELASRLALERTTCSREVAPLVRAGLIEVGVGDDRPTAGCAVVRGEQTGELLAALRTLLQVTEQKGARLETNRTRG